MRRPAIPTVLMPVSAWRPVPSRWPASTIVVAVVVAILVAAGRYTCRKQTTGEQSTDTSKKAASFHGYSFLTVTAGYFVACGQYQVNRFFKRAIGAIDTAAPLFWGSLSAVRQRIPPLPATGNGSILNDVRTDSCQTERIPVIFLTFEKNKVDSRCLLTGTGFLVPARTYPLIRSVAGSKSALSGSRHFFIENVSL